MIAGRLQPFVPPDAKGCIPALALRFIVLVLILVLVLEFDQRPEDENDSVGSVLPALHRRVITGLMMLHDDPAAPAARSAIGQAFAGGFAQSFKKAVNHGFRNRGAT